MKGERTIDDKPFRYGGIMHDYDSTSEEWAEKIPEMRKCYICGGKMQNIYFPSGTLVKKAYPYAGLFRISKGKNEGLYKFRVMCRACAYDLGKGVIEMDGHTYKDKNGFSENKFKADLSASRDSVRITPAAVKRCIGCGVLTVCGGYERWRSVELS